MISRPSRSFYRLLVATGLAALPSLAHAGDPALYLEGGLGAKQGDFGSPTLSRLGLAYGTIGYASDRFDVNLSVPYLRLQTSGGGQDATATGLGDVLVRGIRRLVPETESGFSLDGALAIKFPTADQAKGLGTGQLDVGGFLGLHQRWDQIQATLIGGWIQGQPGSALSNAATANGVYTAGFGLTYLAARGRYSVAYEARGTQYAGVPAPREVSLGIFRMVTDRLAIRGSFIAGLNDGGPRTSVGVGIVYWPK